MIELKLKCYREQAKLSQRNVANSMGISQTYYSLWETGKSYPNAKQILQLCNIFNCSPNGLFGFRGVHNVATDKFVEEGLMCTIEDTSDLLFVQASCFLVAYKNLSMLNHVQFPQLSYTFAPVLLVNIAFSCEMYLKSLYIKENNSSYRYVHNLYSIFAELTKVARTQIINIYTKFVNERNLDFKYDFFNFLNMHSLSFEHWRYYYEYNGDKANPEFLYILALALNQYCIETYLLKSLI